MKQAYAQILGVVLAAGIVLTALPGTTAASGRMPGHYGSSWVGGGPMRGDDGAERQGISVEQATRIARSAYGGRVVAARPAQRGGESGYQIRIVLDDGRVMNVFVDRQGRIR